MQKYRLFKKYSSVLILLLLLLLATAAQGQTQLPTDKHHVLVIHSYNAGYPWTDEIQRAIVDRFGARSDIELHVEFLDLNRNPGPEHWAFLGELLHRKYQPDSINFDLVMVSDDGAMDLVLEHREALFTDVPIVFAGINDYSEERFAGHGTIRGVTGMDETQAIGETLDLIRQIVPGVERIAVVSGSRPTEQIQYRSFVEAAETGHPQFTIKHLNELTEQELSRRLSLLGAETAVIYLSYLLSPAGTTYDYRDAVRMVVENTGSMVFVPTDFLVRDGVVGGRVVDGYEQGRIASQIALRLLDGEYPDGIPMRQVSETRFMFDDRALQRFGIPDEVLPDRSVLINRSPERLIESRLSKDHGIFPETELFDQHGAVMLLVDSASGIIVDANQAAYDFYGYPQLVGRNIESINVLSPEEAAAEMLSAELNRRN